MKEIFFLTRINYYIQSKQERKKSPRYKVVENLIPYEIVYQAGSTNSTVFKLQMFKINSMFRFHFANKLLDLQNKF